jgi:hypothetical protein
LAGGFLCQVLTQQRLMIRVLGFSRQVEVMVGSAMYATGNNLQIADDLTDRTLLCAMDAQCERPGARRFDFNVVEMIHSERERLVAAALTVLRAWQVANASLGVDPYGGFEGWSRRVREPLIWLGRSDPCDSQVSVRKSDPNRSTLEAVLVQWKLSALYVNPADRRHRVKAIIDAALLNSDFYAALVAVAGNASGAAISNDRLGRWLHKVSGKVVGGLRIVNRGVHMGYSTWELQRV